MVKKERAFQACSLAASYTLLRRLSNLPLLITARNPRMQQAVTTKVESSRSQDQGPHEFRPHYAARLEVIPRFLRYKSWSI